MIGGDKSVALLPLAQTTAQAHLFRRNLERVKAILVHTNTHEIVVAVTIF